MGGATKVLNISRDPSPFLKTKVGNLVSRLEHYSKYLNHSYTITIKVGTTKCGILRGKRFEVIGVKQNPVFYLVEGFNIGKNILLDGMVNLINTQDAFLSGVLGWSLKKYCSMRGRKKILIVDVHANIINNKKWLSENWINRFLNWTGKRILRSADYIRTVSPEIKKKLELSGISGEKIFVLPVGTDIRSARKMTSPKRAGRQNMVFVGRLVEGKNVDLLIDAFSELKSKYPDSTLTVVGDGPKRKELEGLSIKLKTEVRFLGVIDHGKLWKQYATADVLVLPSSHEGWGLVVLEAFASGIPVITTRAVEEVNPTVKAGKSAIVADSLDVKGIRKALEAFFVLSDKERSSLVVEGRKRSAKFDIEILAKRRGEILKKISEGSM